MKAGQITAQQFLKRVTYKETGICGNLVNLNDVCPIEESDNEFSEGDIDVDGEPSPNDMDESDGGLNNQVESPYGKCTVCLTASANCVVVPCGHCSMCMECWEKWDKKDTSWFNLVIDSDDEPVDEPTSDESTVTKCPMCLLEVEKVVQLFLI